MSLTIEQEATNYFTMQHIARVRELLDKCVIELIKRGRNHDKSKLESPEVEAFTEKTKHIVSAKFDSPEYIQHKKDMEYALEHHYANNRHHPEHHKNGVDDMNIIDVLEMFCDWKAASERQNGGNIRKSIDICCDKFNISPQLKKILVNSLDLLTE